jgi:hypothetical protein
MHARMKNGSRVVFCLLAMSVALHPLLGQGGFTQFATGPGFSAMGVSVGQDGLLYAQGTLPAYLDWEEERVGEGPGEDLFFAVGDVTGGLVWSRVYGGGGIERISSRPLLSPDRGMWFFHGEAVDSLRMDTFTYRPVVSSFFSFIGIQTKAGEMLRVLPLESANPLVIRTAVWSEDGSSVYLAGRTQGAVLSGADTLLRGHSEPYAFVVRLDSALNVLSFKTIRGVAQPFDLIIDGGTLVLGSAIRDGVLADSVFVQARVQDFDCLLVAWDSALTLVQWHHHLRGVFNKTGVRLYHGSSPGIVGVAGHFIGTITDDIGRSFQSNGFESDLFLWEFDETGYPVSGSVTGSPFEEVLIDAQAMDGGLLLLVQFRLGFRVFDSYFEAQREGLHLALVSIDEAFNAKLEQVFLGVPDVFGFGLLSRDGQVGVLGGFSHELADSADMRLLSRTGNGVIDYFVWFEDQDVGSKDFLTTLDISVYPNPFSDRVTVRRGEQKTGLLDYEVYTVDGTLLQSGQLSRDSEVIRINPNIPGGAFVLRLRGAFGERSFVLFRDSK